MCNEVEAIAFSTRPNKSFQDWAETIRKTKPEREVRQSVALRHNHLTKFQPQAKSSGQPGMRAIFRTWFYI